MPSYQGGKTQIGSKIYQVIKDVETKIEWKSSDYFEPFCGMLGVAIHAAKDSRHVIACDLNEDIILMWKAIQKGWMPSYNSCSKKKYNSLKLDKKHSAERGFIGIACSYSGIPYAGYRGYFSNGASALSMTKRVMQKNYVPFLKNITFLKSDSYDNLVPKGHLTIYCDPPYKNNDYGRGNKHFYFDHEKFWQVMRLWSKNNLVFISEYEAPEDFVCIWKKDVSNSHNSISSNHVEKVFVHKKYANKM